MKKASKIIWISALLCALGPLAHADDYPFRVDPNAVNQNFEGWGMSLAWFGNIIYPGNGRITDWDHWNSAVETVYGPSGLGFTIARYNIGGGENPAFSYLFANNAAYPNTAYMIDGFQTSPGNWNWGADQPQILLLQKAKALGANLFEAFSNSPPYFWLKSGSVTGAAYVDDSRGGESGVTDNLQDANYTDFANYLADVTRYFRDHYGITFRTLDPLNEPRPETKYWLFKQEYPSGKVQEGCHFSISNQVKMLNETYKALQSRGLSTQVSASDDTGIDYSLGSQQAYDPLTRNIVVSQVNTHSYISGDRASLHNLAKQNGKRLWMSEFGTNTPGMDGAIEFVQNIRADLKDLGAEAWIIWQPDWGLMDFPGNNQMVFRKEYYAMKQYSQFIRPGMKILANSDWGSVTAYDPKSGRLVFVTLNESEGDAWINADVSAFAKVSNAQIFLTNANNNMTAQASVAPLNQHIRYQVLARSITTVVVDTSLLSLNHKGK